MHNQHMERILYENSHLIPARKRHDFVSALESHCTRHSSPYWYNQNVTHRIHVWYIYQHVVDLYSL